MYWELIRIGKIIVLIFLTATIFSAALYLSNVDYDQRDPQAEQLQLAQLDAALAEKLGSMNFGMERYSAWAAKYSLALSSNTLEADLDGDEMPNYLEYVYGTDPKNQDTDNDGYADKQELINGFDPNDDGKSRLKVVIKIEKIGIEAPMVWSNSENDTEMLRDLENGVSHFYKTASPGQAGNMIVSGHSSNYSWAKGDYNYVFKDLDNLLEGDVILVNASQANGRTVEYRYVVTKKFVTTPDDQAVFAQPETPILTLSTCWPLNTNLKRLIVQAELEK